MEEGLIKADEQRPQELPGMSLEDSIDSMFLLQEKDWSQYAPLTLAYIGDSVFDLVVRTVLVKRSRVQAWKLHQKASRIVRATSQAKMAQALQGEFTEEEASIYRRGRNASPGHHAKNASQRDYLEATGLEALVGYLYLKGEQERLVWLIRSGIEAIDN